MKTMTSIVMLSLILSLGSCFTRRETNSMASTNSSAQIQKDEDSTKLDKVIRLIVNEKRLNGNIENAFYGEMVSGVFEIVNDTNFVELNQKVELMVLMIFFQEHYLDAYGSTVSVNSTNLNLDSKKLNYLFKPYQLFSDSLLVSEPDTLFIERLNQENKDLFVSIGSLTSSESNNAVLEYWKILRKYVNKQKFYDRYSQHFYNVPVGQLR